MKLVFFYQIIVNQNRSLVYYSTVAFTVKKIIQKERERMKKMKQDDASEMKKVKEEQRRIRLMIHISYL